MSKSCFLVESDRFDQQCHFEFEYACSTFHRFNSSTLWMDPTSTKSIVPIDYVESQWMLVSVLGLMVDWMTVSTATCRSINGWHQAAKVKFGRDHVLDQPPVSTRWVILQQRVDGDVDAYMDSVHANVLGQVRWSDPSGSTLSSKLVETYPTMSEFVHHHLASWACWSEKVIRLVMLMAVHSCKFIPTNIHHQVPGIWFVKLVKAKDTFQRMLKNQNRD